MWTRNSFIEKFLIGEALAKARTISPGEKENKYHSFSMAIGNVELKRECQNTRA